MTEIATVELIHISAPESSHYTNEEWEEMRDAAADLAFVVFRFKIGRDAFSVRALIDRTKVDDLMLVQEARSRAIELLNAALAATAAWHNPGLPQPPGTGNP